MIQATFWNLHHQLQPHLEQQDTGICPALPADSWLALALLKLAMPTSLQYVRQLFNVGKATTRQAIL